jgi:ABC-2 type transport system ATP-binding protein
VFGFLGPNSAGKSTTINMVLGFLQPTSGSVSVLGMDVTRESLAIRQ